MKEHPFSWGVRLGKPAPDGSGKIVSMIGIDCKKRHEVSALLEQLFNWAKERGHSNYATRGPIWFNDLGRLDIFVW